MFSLRIMSFAFTLFSHIIENVTRVFKIVNFREKGPIICKKYNPIHVPDVRESPGNRISIPESRSNIHCPGKL